MGPGGDDRVDVLILGTVSDQDDVVRLHLVQDSLQFGNDGQIGLVSHLFIPTNERYGGIHALFLKIHACADGCIQGVQIRILRIGDTERISSGDTVLYTYDRSGYFPLDAVIVVPVNG